MKIASGDAWRNRGDLGPIEARQVELSVLNESLDLVDMSLARTTHAGLMDRSARLDRQQKGSWHRRHCLKGPTP